MADHNGLVIPPPNIELPPAPAAHAAEGGEDHRTRMVVDSESAVHFVWTVEPEAAVSERGLRKSDEAERRDSGSYSPRSSG